MNFFRLVNHWVHLLSAIFWIGGIAFTSVVLLPSMRKTLSERVAQSVLLAVHKQFVLITFVLTFVLMVTGVINIGTNRHGGTLPTQYLSILGAKLFLVVIFLSIAWANFAQIRRNPDLSLTGEPPFQRLSLVLGVMIIFLAAFLRTLYPH